jgi:hypothetical protein
MSIGWFASLSQARTYFEDERLETEAWDDLFLSTGTLETKVLKQAYNRLYYDPRWSLPTYAEASADQLVELQKANAEMAYYLAVHLADEDRRKGLQAQGVTQAGVVKETYSEKYLMGVPVPPFVIAILKPWETAKPFGAVNVARDEEYSVDTKVHDF